MTDNPVQACQSRFAADFLKPTLDGLIQSWYDLHRRDDIELRDFNSMCTLFLKKKR